MGTFLDSNILCRLAKEDDPQHEMAKLAIQQVIKQDGGAPPVINAQVEREFLCVATKKLEKNGLGMPSVEALKMIESFRAFCEFRHDTPAVHERMKQLMAEFAIAGSEVHDAGIAAAASTHGLKLLSFNQDHFRRFHEKGDVLLLAPESLAREQTRPRAQADMA